MCFFAFLVADSAGWSGGAGRAAVHVCVGGHRHGGDPVGARVLRSDCRQGRARAGMAPCPIICTVADTLECWEERVALVQSQSPGVRPGPPHERHAMSILVNHCGSDVDNDL
eukprot:4817289-Pyramimonas_sp.AAC.1